MPPTSDGPSRAQLRRIRWAVRATLTLGVAASVTANVLHARQNPIAQAIAAWPPCALLLTVELISRVPVHRRSLAAVRMLATATIAGIAAWVSYWHMAGVAARYGEATAAAHLIPLSVDGLVVVASVSLVELAGVVRAVRSTLLQAAGAPVNLAAPEPQRPAETPEQTRTPDDDIEAPVIEAPEPVDPAIERAARRAAALAELARPDADVEQIATDAGVTVETVRRWAIEATARTRRQRGGARKPAAEPELVAAIAAGEAG